MIECSKTYRLFNESVEFKNGEFMRVFAAVLLVLATSKAAMADTTYQCDFYDLSATEQAVGSGPLSVVIKDGGGADVYSEPQYNPSKIKTKIHELDIWSQDGRIYSQKKSNFGSEVSFTKSSDEKAGLLKIDSISLSGDMGYSTEQSFICTK